MDAQCVDAAASSSLFRGVAYEDVTRWLDDPRCEAVCFQAGEAISSPHEFRRSLLILCCGRAKIIKNTADGRAMLMNVLMPAQLSSAAAVFGGREEYIATIVAEQPCRALFFSQTFLEEIFSSDPRIALNYIHFLSDRIRFLNAKIEGFTGASALSRLALYLRSLESEGMLKVDCSMGELAEMLNIGRASLYRALDRLEREGLIRREGKTVFIHDGKALAKYNGITEEYEA